MNKINANSFPWIPSNLVFYDIERWYIDMNWINRSTGMWFDPIFQSVDLDPKLKERQDLGKKVLLTINQSPDWRLEREGVPFESGWTETKLGKWKKDGTKAESWKEQAGDFFKIAARYGRKVWPKEVLGVDENIRWGRKNEPLSGLNLVDYIEPGNEDRAWWRSDTQSLTPEEFAAYCSAVYDEIKRADFSMKMVMPGLPNLDLDCLKRMLVWFTMNRPDGKFACDIINVHHYSNSGNKPDNLQAQWFNGCSPEQDNVRIKLKQIVDFGKALGIPVWWSEFGYNTINQNTTQGIVPFGGKSTEQIQSEWLKRSYLEGMLAGVDQMFMFETADENRRETGGMWVSCGLVKSQYNNEGNTDSDTYKPKLSWYGLKDLYTWTKDAKFIREDNKDGIRILSFTINDKIRYIYYLPTSTGFNKSFDINEKTLTAIEDPQMHEESILVFPPDPPMDPNPPIKLIEDTHEITIRDLKTGKITKTLVRL